MTMQPPMARPVASNAGKVKTWDILVRARLDEARCVQSRGRTPEEAIENAKLDSEDRVMSVSERPETY